MRVTVWLSPQDKHNAFFRLDSVGSRQFAQLAAQYRRIHKIDAVTNAEIIRWIITQYTDTPCELASLRSYCATQHIGPVAACGGRWWLAAVAVDLRLAFTIYATVFS